MNIYPWTMTKRPEEKILISDFEQTDFYQRVVQDGITRIEKYQLGGHISVEHIRKDEFGLHAIVCLYGTGQAQPEQTYFLTVHPNKSETQTLIQYRIDNEFGRVEVYDNRPLEKQLN